MKSRLFGAFCVRIFIVLAWTGSCNLAFAAPVTWIYEGVISSASGGAAFDAYVGETLRLSQTFDDTTADADADSTSGLYGLGTTAVELTLGALTYSLASVAPVPGHQVINDTIDKYIVSGFLSGPDIGGLPVTAFELTLTDNSATAFSSDALPSVQPNPADFGDNRSAIDVSFGVTSAFFVVIDPQIVAATAALPVPGAVWLFSSGLLGLFGVAKRKRA